jgi:hypothetical protein
MVGVEISQLLIAKRSPIAPNELNHAKAVAEMRRQPDGLAGHGFQFDFGERIFGVQWRSDSGHVGLLSPRGGIPPNPGGRYAFQLGDPR